MLDQDQVRLRGAPWGGVDSVNLDGGRLTIAAISRLLAPPSPAGRRRGVTTGEDLLDVEKPAPARGHARM
jgi:hypothetical protein